jgi:hypothetical protein
MGVMARSGIALLPLVLIALLGAAIVVMVIAKRRRRVVTDPECGKCGYCVRGLEHMTCPECGSDLREVGIITPTNARPLSNTIRLLIWTLIVPLPAIVIGGLLGALIGPRQMITTDRRVVFVSADYLSETFTIQRTGSKLTWGPQNLAARVPPQTMWIMMGRPVGGAMTVSLPDQQYRFTDSSGQQITGTFDASAIEKWLNAQGFNDPRVADRAADIHAAIVEMDTPAGPGFSRFAPDPQRGNLPAVQAHPTFSFTRPGDLWPLVHPIAAIILLWLAGAWFILRRRTPNITPDRAALAAV